MGGKLFDAVVFVKKKEVRKVDNQERKIVKFYDPLRHQINQAFLSLETRITVDRLLNRTGAKLVKQQGREVQVHPDTVRSYFHLYSLIYDYMKRHQENAEPQDLQLLEAMRDKWTTPARRDYFRK